VRSALRGSIAGVLIALASALACEAPDSDGPAVRNLVLVSIDTLRADHLSLYGYTRETSPVLDAFARGAVVFTRAISASNETIASHHALFQSVLPTRALSRAHRAPTLTTILRKGGWRTAAFTDGGPMSAQNGFARGFDVFDAGNEGLEHSLPKAIGWLDEVASGPEPFFLFVHAFDVHSPYDPGHPWDTRFFREYEGPITGATSETVLRGVRRLSEHEHRREPREVASDDRRKIGALYDGGIARADDLLGSLLARLDASDLRDVTAIAILSDHGEEFWDHGSVLHSHTLYQELLHVPLILRVPGWEERAGRVHPRVSLLDVTPTLLEILGQEAPAAVHGRSLVPLVHDGAETRRAFPSEGVSAGSYLQSVIQGRYKLIRRNHEPGAPVELYDLEDDPGERVDLATTLPDIRERLAELLDRKRLDDRSAISHPLDDPGQFDAQTRERLRALGYLE